MFEILNKVLVAGLIIMLLVVAANILKAGADEAHSIATNTVTDFLDAPVRSINGSGW